MTAQTLFRNAVATLLTAALAWGAQTALAADAPMNSRLGAAVADTPQDSPARPQGLAALLREAFAQNPGAAAARASWLAALQEHPQATALPDPMLEFMREENGYELMLSQMFPARGMLRIKGSMADARAEMARLNYEMTVRNLVTDVRTRYAELQYLDRAIELTTQNLALVERLVSISQRDYGSGKAPLNDLMRAQAQHAQVGYDLLLLREVRDTETARMNALLNRAPETPLTVLSQQPVAAPALDIESLYEIAQAARHEILMAEIGEAMGELDMGMAKKMSRPEFVLGVTRQSMERSAAMSGADAEMGAAPASSGNDVSWKFTVGMTVPLWAARNRAAVRGAEHKLEAARHARQQSLNQAHEQIKSLLFKIRTSARLVELYEQTLVPQARQALEQSEAFYNAGASSIPEIIEVQAVWLNFELALARARADLTQNIAMLEMTVGAPIDSISGGGAQ